MNSSTTPCTVAGSKPWATSVARSSPEQKSRRDSSITAAALAAAASADCPGARARLRGLFLNTLGRHHLEADLVLDFLGDVRVLLQVHARIVLALTDALAVVAVPGAGLVDDALRGADLDDLALARDAGAIHDLELGFAKRRRHLVLDDLDARLVADHFLAILDGADSADVEPHRGVELERVAAGRGLGVAEHHADLHANLIDEDHDRVRALDVAGQLTQRLRHQPRMQATCSSPISPSISARGVNAATESITTTSTPPERTSMSVISSACSPVSGCETSRSCTWTPRAPA